MRRSSLINIGQVIGEKKPFFNIEGSQFGKGHERNAKSLSEAYNNIFFFSQKAIPRLQVCHLFLSDIFSCGKTEVRNSIMD